MSISPERFCLGGLMKDIDKDSNPEEIDSKEDTLYKSSLEQNILSNNSAFSSTFSSSLFFPTLAPTLYSSEKIKEEEFSHFEKKNILLAFNNQKSTKQLQKCLIEASEETIDYIIKELSGFSFL